MAYKSIEERWEAEEASVRLAKLTPEEAKRLKAEAERLRERIINDRIRENSIREYQDEIQWCKDVLLRDDISEDDKVQLQERLAEAEKALAAVLKM